MSDRRLAPFAPALVTLLFALSGCVTSVPAPAPSTNPASGVAPTPLSDSELAVLEERVGPRSAELIEPLTQRAFKLVNERQPKAALPVAKRALELAERYRAPEHPDVFKAQHLVGHIYLSLADNVTARRALETALATAKRLQVNMHYALAGTYNELGVLSNRAGNFERAATELALALHHARQSELPMPVGPMLTNLGQAQRRAGQVDGALATLHEAQTSFESTTPLDKGGLATVFNEFGQAYQGRGDLAAALGAMQRSLELAIDAFGATNGVVGQRQHNLANLLRDLGQGDRARELSASSRAIYAVFYGQNSYYSASAEALNASLLRDAGNLDEARRAFARTLEISRIVLGDKHPEYGALLRAAAAVESKAGDSASADRMLTDALAIHEAAYGRDHWQVASTLTDLAWVQLQKGDIEAARATGIRALPLALQARTRALQWQLERLHGRINRLDGNFDIAVFWGKEAVNTLQEMRSDMSSLDRQIQRTFVEDRRKPYLELAEWLIDLGRIAEAQDVIALLKDDEFFDFILRDANVAGTNRSAPFSGRAEQITHAELARIRSRLEAAAGQLALIERRARATASPDDETVQRELLRAELAAGRAALDAFLAALSQRFRRGEIEVAAISRPLAPGALAGGDAWVQYLVGGHRVAMIVTHARGQFVRHYAIADQELNRMVAALNDAVRTRGDPLPSARALHRVLVQPLERELKALAVKRLLISADGALRYVPFASLHDGQRYFVETYTHRLIADAAGSSAEASYVGRLDRMEGMGLTVAIGGFQPLPAVRAELEIIQRAHVPGSVYLDNEFTKGQLLASFDTGPSLVHIASHFQFRPGSELDSFLLLGDGTRMSLREFRTAPRHRRRTGLVTLSACSTATGGGRDDSGREVEGLATIVLSRGASEVVATLWAVADTGTMHLMGEFYRHRSDGQHSSDLALQLAQLHALRSKRSASAGSASDLSHPFYWAGIVVTTSSPLQ